MRITLKLLSLAAALAAATSVAAQSSDVRTEPAPDRSSTVQQPFDGVTGSNARDTGASTPEPKRTARVTKVASRKVHRARHARVKHHRHTKHRVVRRRTV
jgi:hypothetical protein